MYYLLKFLRKVLLKAPLWICFLLGRTIGLFFYLNGKKRMVAFKNIRLAFPRKKDSEIKLILRKSFDNFGLSLIESLIAPRIYKNIKIEGDENIGSDGGICIGIHAGNWEVASFVFAHKHNLAVLTKQQKNKGVDRFLNDLRSEAGLKVCLTLKELIRYLRKDFLIGMVIDHGAEDNALLVEFFSHLVPTPRGAVFLGKKFNKKIYPYFGYRKKGFSHVGKIGKPIQVQGKDDKELLRDINRLYEDYLRKYPWEYLWYYKRFKRKKDLDILILSDRKMGHLKQSQALLSFFKEENYEIRSKIVEVKYKNRLARFFSDLCAFLTYEGWFNCGRYLSLFVDKRTTQELKNSPADIVISTGSAVAPINKLFSSSIAAKSVTILRPNIPLKKFDLSIIPEHDRIQEDFAVKIKGALFHPINPNDSAKTCKSYFGLDGVKKISFFLGGYLDEEKKFLNNLGDFIGKLKEFSLNKEYKILISTSRRTTEKAEEIIEKELKNFRNTEVIVYPRRKNYDFVFEGFIFLSEIVFISSESISMISESLSFKKPCVCVFLQKQENKHKVFLDSIEKEASFLKSPYNIEEIKPKASSLFEDNRRVIKEAIRKLL